MPGAAQVVWGAVRRRGTKPCLAHGFDTQDTYMSRGSPTHDQRLTGLGEQPLGLLRQPGQSGQRREGGASASDGQKILFPGSPELERLNLK